MGMMSDRHFGYEQRTHYALAEVFGSGYMDRELNLVWYSPWVDVWDEKTGVVEHQRIERIAFVAEGTVERLHPEINELVKKLSPAARKVLP